MSTPATLLPDPAPAPFLDERKSLACIHCGLCLASCPTYLETGNENDSPRGRIYLMRALQDGRLDVGGDATRHIDLCLGCRACEAVCPSGVEYGHLLEHTRDHVERHLRRGWFQQFLRRVAIEGVFPFPERMEVALAPARWIRRLGLDRFMPGFLREALSLVPRMAEPGDVPEFSPATRPHGGDALPGRTDGHAGRAGFIRGCVMPLMFGSTQASSVGLLNERGLDVVAPRGQVCCGALYAHSGQLEKARANARRNIEVFEQAGVDLIVINAAGCGSTLKEYGGLLADDPAWAERARAFAAKVRDLSEVLVPRGGTGGGLAGGGEGAGQRDECVTCHDACHLAHAQRITRQPRDLVRGEDGIRYVELAEADVCCGSAGTYNLTEPAMAARLQERKVENILKSGATTVVTTNPGCLLQIRAGLEKAGRTDIRAEHLADFLARRRGCGAKKSAGAD